MVRTHSRKKHKRDAFPDVNGKIVEAIEMVPLEAGYAIGIMFRDRTYLSFYVEPSVRITPDLSNWKTKNYKPLKRWQKVLGKTKERV